MKNSSSSSWASARSRAALGQVRLQIRPKILVQPAQPAVVVPAQPEDGMAQTQGLERLVEAGGGMGRRPLQHLGQIVPAQRPGPLRRSGGPVPAPRRWSPPRRPGRSPLPGRRPGGPGRPRRPSRRASRPWLRTMPQSAQMLLMGPSSWKVRPARSLSICSGRYSGGIRSDRAGEDDALIRLDHHGLGLAHSPGQPGCPPGPVETLALAFSQDVDRGGAAEAMVLAGPDAPFHLRQSGRQFRQGARRCSRIVLIGPSRPP